MMKQPTITQSYNHLFNSLFIICAKEQKFKINNFCGTIAVFPFCFSFTQLLIPVSLISQ